MFNAAVPKHLKNGAPRSAGNTPFRRVKEETVDIDHRLTDNSFEAKVSAEIRNLILDERCFCENNKIVLKNTR